MNHDISIENFYVSKNGEVYRTEGIFEVLRAMFKGKKVSVVYDHDRSAVFADGVQIVKMDKNNKIEELYLPGINSVGNDFLVDLPGLKKLSMPDLERCGNHFLGNNEQMIELDLPKLKSAGDMFMAENKTLKKINIPRLESVGREFLDSNESLTDLQMPSLIWAGDRFLVGNKNLKNISAPTLNRAGDEFLYNNRALKELDLPSLTMVGTDFLRYNQNVEKVHLPNLKTAGAVFMQYTREYNDNLVDFYAPGLEKSGSEEVISMYRAIKMIVAKNCMRQQIENSKAKDNGAVLTSMDSHSM